MRNGALKGEAGLVFDPDPGSSVTSRGLMRLRALLDNRLAVIGGMAILGFVAFCFVGPVIYHTNQISTNLAAVNLPPGTAHHPLGTDAVGYDELGRLMVGGQASLEIGLGAAVLAIFLGIVWGATAGMVGGALDSVMMRFVDAVLSIPIVALLLVVATLVTPSVPVMIVMIASVSWPVPARLVRAETLRTIQRDFVQASTVMGASYLWVLRRHIVPSSYGTITVNASFQVADAILYVAYLSFLGLGIPPPAANWGGMLSDGVNYLLQGYWWQVWPAGTCILVVVIAFNLVGDGVREVVDTRLVRR